MILCIPTLRWEIIDRSSLDSDAPRSLFQMFGPNEDFCDFGQDIWDTLYLADLRLHAHPRQIKES